MAASAMPPPAGVRVPVFVIKLPPCPVELKLASMSAVLLCDDAAVDDHVDAMAMGPLDEQPPVAVGPPLCTTAGLGAEAWAPGQGPPAGDNTLPASRYSRVAYSAPPLTPPRNKQHGAEAGAAVCTTPGR